MNNLSIFDQYGVTLKDIDPAEVAALDKNDQAVLLDTLSACTAAEDHDTLLAGLVKSIHSLMRAHDAAVAADIKANPGVSPVDATRAWIAAQNGQPAPTKKKLDKKARQALVDAVTALADVRDDHSRALVKQKTLHRARGEAIVRWMQTQQKVDPLSLAREAATKFTPNPVEHVVHRHAIDALPAGENKSRMRTPSNLKAMPKLGLKY